MPVKTRSGALIGWMPLSMPGESPEMAALIGVMSLSMPGESPLMARPTTWNGPAHWTHRKIPDLTKPESEVRPAKAVNRGEIDQGPNQKQRRDRPKLQAEGRSTKQENNRLGPNQKQRRDRPNKKIMN
jgi:hypothetical protein